MCISFDLCSIRAPPVVFRLLGSAQLFYSFIFTNKLICTHISDLGISSIPAFSVSGSYSRFLHVRLSVAADFLPPHHHMTPCPTLALPPSNPPSFTPSLPLLILHHLTKRKRKKTRKVDDEEPSEKGREKKKTAPLLWQRWKGGNEDVADEEEKEKERRRRRADDRQQQQQLLTWKIGERKVRLGWSSRKGGGEA